MNPFRQIFCYSLIGLLIGWISLHAELLINELDSDTPDRTPWNSSNCLTEELETHLSTVW